MRDKGMTMKKLQHIIMIALILIGLATPALAQDQTDSFNVAAKHAIAIETTTGKVLYEKDATTPDGVASMTKILTAYMVYKAVDQGKITWDTEVGISDYPFNLTVNSEVSNVPLDSRKYTVKQLLDATLISSANSAAIALAEKISGTESTFVDTMTAQLKEWGITDAKLFNASSSSTMSFERSPCGTVCAVGSILASSPSAAMSLTMRSRATKRSRPR